MALTLSDTTNFQQSLWGLLKEHRGGGIAISCFIPAQIEFEIALDPAIIRFSGMASYYLWAHICTLVRSIIRVRQPRHMSAAAVASYLLVRQPFCSLASLAQRSSAQGEQVSDDPIAFMPKVAGPESTKPRFAKHIKPNLRSSRSCS